MDTATSADRSDEFSLAALQPNDGDAAPHSPGEARPRWPAWLRLGAPTWIWAGVAVAAAGFILIAIAWGDVAGESLVYRQLPYLVSAGLSGIGLVLVGLTIINVGTRQRDAIDRDRQIGQVAAILEELRAILDEEWRR